MNSMDVPGSKSLSESGSGDLNSARFGLIPEQGLCERTQTA